MECRRAEDFHVVFKLKVYALCLKLWESCRYGVVPFKLGLPFSVTWGLFTLLTTCFSGVTGWYLWITFSKYYGIQVMKYFLFYNDLFMYSYVHSWKSNIQTWFCLHFLSWIFNFCTTAISHVYKIKDCYQDVKLKYTRLH